MNLQTALRAALLLLAVATLRPVSAVENPVPNTDGSDFIRTSCNATLYPDLCYASLASYNSTVQNDPARLASVAITVSLSQARELAAYVANLTRGGGTEPRAASALRDCVSNLGDAVDEMRDSLKQMRDMAPRGSPVSFRFKMSNVQTWMSAALTDEDTCTEGFEGVEDTSDVKNDVCNRVSDVKKVTSNALALINQYAQKATG